MAYSPFRISQTVTQLVNQMHRDTGVQKDKIYTVLLALGDAVKTTTDLKHKTPKIFAKTRTALLDQILDELNN